MIFSDKDRKRLLSFTDNLLSLNRKLNLGTSILTPLNYLEEKNKFFRSETYNPHFIYQKQDTSASKKELLSLIEQLKTIKLPSDIHSYLYNYLESADKTFSCIDSIGTEKFADTAHHIFPFQNVDGKNFLRIMPTISFCSTDTCKIRDAEEMAEIFREYIKETGLTCEIVIDYHNDHIIRVHRNKLIIGAKVKRYCGNVKRLIVHEIESHVFQRNNLAKTENPLLRIFPHADSMLWGEGLAVYNEINSGTITQTAYETYYYRLKAVEMIQKSFREIFEYLSRYVKPEKAYMITYRVKRGMGDTSLGGGYAKDASYALGYTAVNSYLKNNGSIELLYLCRVPDIGKLLLENELLEPTTVKLPKRISTQSKYMSPSQHISPRILLR